MFQPPWNTRMHWVKRGGESAACWLPDDPSTDHGFTVAAPIIIPAWNFGAGMLHSHEIQGLCYVGRRRRWGECGKTGSSPRLFLSSRPRCTWQVESSTWELLPRTGTGAPMKRTSRRCWLVLSKDIVPPRGVLSMTSCCC